MSDCVPVVNGTDVFDVSGSVSAVVEQTDGAVRDMFAAHAMAALAASFGMTETARLANRAFEIADAMMAERGKR